MAKLIFGNARFSHSVVKQKQKQKQKEAKYYDACRAQNIEFCALAVETTGAWEEGAAILINRLAKSLARSSSQDEGECAKHLFGKLSKLVALWPLILII